MVGHEGAPQSVLVTGGAGYIGSVLVPRMLAEGHRVTVLDALIFGSGPLRAVVGNERFRLVQGDIRDVGGVDRCLGMDRFDAVVHLAAISNDPSSELDPMLTRQVNLSGVENLMAASRRHGVRRFIYASSASVYGVKDVPEVTEEMSLGPLTLYAECKAQGEQVLWGLLDDAFCGVAVRSATVCGYSPRLRLDLTINILSCHALTSGSIRVFGGDQLRPNVHIADLADFYVSLLTIERDKIQGKAFNVSTRNATVAELAELVRREINPGISITVVPTDDKRSYHLSATRAARELGFVPSRPLELAPRELRSAFSDGRVRNPMDAIYRNVEWMKARAPLSSTSSPAS